MATEVRSFTVTVPAGTPATAPVLVPTAFPPRIVDAIQIVVPPGPGGLVGFAITVSGVTVIPYLSDAWIVTAGENITWPLEQQVDSGDWGVRAYNTGTVDHSIYVRYLLRPTTPTADVKPAMMADAQIVPPSDLALE